ncbi:hypothetical protein [Pseudomonas sp. NyZ201]|uniref:hypothetical protein n=1 Tax=Pseudomonas sp. NyZ201 TaxID=3409857 RepID=UPI003CECE942
MKILPLTPPIEIDVFIFNPAQLGIEDINVNWITSMQSFHLPGNWLQLIIHLEQPHRINLEKKFDSSPPFPTPPARESIRSKPPKHLQGKTDLNKSLQLSTLTKFKNTNPLGSVSLGVYLETKAELEASDREILRLRQILAARTTKSLENYRQRSGSLALDHYLTPPSEASDTIFYIIIGSILEVVLSKPSSKKVNSIYPTQAAIVEAITMRFPGVHGLSKRTLDRKFAEARRRFAQARLA